MVDGGNNIKEATWESVSSMLQVVSTTPFARLPQIPFSFEPRPSEFDTNRTLENEQFIFQMSQQS